MDSFSSHESVVVDSQPSQILREVLRAPADTPNDSPLEEGSSYMDCDSPAARSRTAPSYHYHGLAATQTESQFSDLRATEGSQMGNVINTDSAAVIYNAKLSLFSAAKDSSRSNAIDPSHALDTPFVRSSNYLPKTNKPPILISSCTTTITSQNNTRQLHLVQPPSLYRRSSSPASQDSFAGPPLRGDPEQEFLAVSKQFGVPLAELGVSPEDARTSAPSTSVAFNNTSTDMASSESRDQSRAQQPDISGFSTSTFQEEHTSQDANYDDYIVNNHNRDVFIERNSQFAIQFEQSPNPTTPSEFEAPSPPLEQPTQVLEPTQIIGQFAEEPTQITERPIPPTDQNLAQQDLSSVSTGTPTSSNIHPTSLYTMPNVKRRLQLQGVKIPPSAQPAGRIILQPSPSSVIFPQNPTQESMSVGDVGLCFPPPACVPTSNLLVATGSREDNTEIVPDSEPPRADRDQSERLGKSPQIVLPGVDNDNMVMPDLLEKKQTPSVTELSNSSQDDDIPLAISVLNVRGKQRAVYVEKSAPGAVLPLATHQPVSKDRRASKKQELDTSSAPAPRVTRSRGAENPPADSSPTKAKFQKSITKSKGKGKRQSKDDSATRKRKTPASFEDEAKTEFAVEENYMDTSFKLDDVPHSRKRKRVASTATKGSTTSVKSAIDNSITPLARSTKQLRSAPESAKGKDFEPTRVFAKWSFSGNYYSGIIYSRSVGHGNRYIVKFDDDTECDVAIDNLRRCEFQIGDTVYVIEHRQMAVVTAINISGRSDSISIEMNGIKLDLGSTNIRISESLIEEQWRTRLIQPSSIIPVLQEQSLKTTPSRSSVINGTSSAKFFKHVGFVVTLSLGNNNWTEERDRLMKMIEGKGGRLISDWSSIFDLSGDHHGKTWNAGQAHVNYLKLGGQNDIRWVFLLSDRPNQKPKYLIALALGIPCVHIDWVKFSVKENSLLDWPSFLLPAGHCPSIDTLASQRINLKWGDKTQDLVNIGRNLLASKLFQEKSVICVGGEMFPQAKTIKRQNNYSSDQEGRYKEAARSVPRIALAMGAERVEAVCDPRDASAALTQFDYVIVKDEGGVKKFTSEDVACVHVAWLKECLIASQLLPLPDLREEDDL